MSESNPREALSRLLQLTRDEELDCDAFLEHIAVFVEGGLTSPSLVALMEHHRLLCPECEEELVLLKRAVRLPE